MAIDDVFAVSIHDFQELSIVLGVDIRRELAKSNEIFSIDTMVAGAIESESADIEASFGGLNTSSKSWLLLINRD